MIRFDHVVKRFPGHTNALSDITVEIKDGEFIFVIGPSGAGKTTLLRLITRDLSPTEGDIFVADWQLSRLPDSQIHLLRRTVGTVFQDFKLLTDRTVFENVALGLEILGKSEKEIEQRVGDVLDLVGLAKKSNFFPQQLSAGEMQRTGIARAIVGGPKILLADEPTGNLDPKTAEEILDILQEINKIGTTIIMATHNAHVVNELKKRTVVLRGGKLVSDEEKGKYKLDKDEDVKKHGKKHESS